MMLSVVMHLKKDSSTSSRKTGKKKRAAVVISGKEMEACEQWSQRFLAKCQKQKTAGVVWLSQAKTVTAMVMKLSPPIVEVRVGIVSQKNK